MKKRSFAVFLLLLFCLSGTLPTAAALQFQAASAFVMDGDTGEELYSYNGDAARVPASMTKVLTSYIVYQELAAGRLSLDTPIKVSQNAAAKSRDSSYPMAVPLTAGATYTVDTLLHLIMIPSASASCIVMAEHISGSEQAFVARMNQTAKDLGLNATYFNCHGARPNYITPRSQAQLTKQFIDTYPDILRITGKSGFRFGGKYYNNTNHLLNTMGPYEGIDGFKTGTIAESGYCVTTTAVRNGRRVIAVVMRSTSDRQRFDDSRQLLDYGFDQIAKRDAARAATTMQIVPLTHSIRPYQTADLQMQLHGVTTPYTAKAQWYVDGVPVPGYGNDAFQATATKTSTLHYTLRELSGETLTVAFVLTMPDGTEKRSEVVVPVEQRPVSYTGSLNIQRAAVYPGKTLTVTADIAGENDLAHVQLPACWQLDGQPIPGYTNAAFTILHDAAQSAYTLSIPADAAPGVHTLSFCLGAADATAVVPLVLTAEIEVVRPAQTAPAA
ncbi:MAG: D-alanyl-D-alanine carboxypeptidase family protein [Eubacteriales bacterium]|nr:D-alanyl-D-alanine carboxypeptidase family protein [Eubacteriales bacterium]